MPIRPEEKKRYPKNWKDIRKKILDRAGNKCEFCGVENYAIRENGSRVVLTVAHLDHTPEHCEPENLRALCQKCHNTYDGKHRAETRKQTRKEQEARRRAAARALQDQLDVKKWCDSQLAERDLSGFMSYCFGCFYQTDEGCTAPAEMMAADNLCAENCRRLEEKK